MQDAIGTTLVFQRANSQSLYLRGGAGFDFLVQVEFSYPALGSISLVTRMGRVTAMDFPKNLESISRDIPGLRTLAPESFPVRNLAEGEFLFTKPARRKGALWAEFLGRNGVSVGGHCSLTRDGRTQILVENSPEYSRLPARKASGVMARVEASFNEYLEALPRYGLQRRILRELLKYPKEVA